MSRTPRQPARGGLSAHTARRILRDVHERGLKVGESLGDESWLIEKYEVSRGTLREALKLLSFLGAITVKAGPRGGPHLTTPGSAVVGSAMGMVVQFRGATLRSVFEARAAIEPAVAGLAAVKRNETDLRQLDRQVDLLRGSQATHGPVYAAESEKFNLLLAEASHNEVLATTVPALAAMTAAVTWRYGPGMRGELTERIGQVVDAVRAADAAGASAVHTEMFSWLIDELGESQPARMAARILWPDVDDILSTQRYE